MTWTASFVPPVCTDLVLCGHPILCRPLARSTRRMCRLGIWIVAERRAVAACAPFCGMLPIGGMRVAHRRHTTSADHTMRRLKRSRSVPVWQSVRRSNPWRCMASQPAPVLHPLVAARLASATGRKRPRAGCCMGHRAHNARNGHSAAMLLPPTPVAALWQRLSGGGALAAALRPLFGAAAEGGPWVPSTRAPTGHPPEGLQQDLEKARLCLRRAAALGIGRCGPPPPTRFESALAANPTAPSVDVSRRPCAGQGRLVHCLTHSLHCVALLRMCSRRIVGPPPCRAARIWPFPDHGRHLSNSGQYWWIVSQTMSISRRCWPNLADLPDSARIGTNLGDFDCHMGAAAGARHGGTIAGLAVAASRRWRLAVLQRPCARLRPGRTGHAWWRACASSRPCGRRECVGGSPHLDGSRVVPLPSRSGAPCGRCSGSARSGRPPRLVAAPRGVFGRVVGARWVGGFGRRPLLGPPDGRAAGVAVVWARPLRN